MAKTAVSQFCEELEKLVTIETFQKYAELKAKALETEKQQIKSAYRAATGCQNPTSERMVALGTIFDKQASDYYNEKYKPQ
jgi:predicted patatin/cPLA2 family phospholipase